MEMNEEVSKMRMIIEALPKEELYLLQGEVDRQVMLLEKALQLYEDDERVFAKG